MSPGRSDMPTNATNGFGAYAQQPTWGYRQLLDPKSAGKKAAPTANGTSNGSSSSMNPSASATRLLQNGAQRPANDDQESAATTMLERLHNVQQRQQLPRKRIRIDLDGDDDDSADGDDAAHGKKTQFSGRGGHGPLGQYVKEKQQQGMRENPQAPTIDLTGQADDETAVVKENGDVEVCLGRIDGARVMAHQVPHPRMNSSASTSKTWPSMKVELLRRPGINSSIIGCHDAQGKDFGSIDVRTASVLAPLMDSVKTSCVRLVARLDARVRQPFDYPGSPASTSYSIAINVYAPRKMVTGIGRLFSQKQVWLREPFMADRGVLVVNPHTPKDHTPKLARQQHGAPTATSSRYANGGVSVVRTQEEIKRDVGRIFDTIKGSAEPPEMAQPARILTPLLPHQRQALHFMTRRELVDGDAGFEKDETSLWQEQFRDNGASDGWLNVVTGMLARQRPESTRGGILADVMGLGKTLNVLALTVSTLDEARAFARDAAAGDLAPIYDDEATDTELRLASRATLIVCPVSTVSNWEEQIKRHVSLTPRLKWTIYHGQKRTNEPEELADYDVVITTYSTCSADHNSRARSRPNKPLAEIKWFRIVLDEAHLIREQNTRQSRAVCNLSSQRRWAVTGTPVQNKLDDLGALLKFLHIKPFDESGVFARHIIAPFKLADTDVIEKLQVLVNSITLRRLKDRIDLPSRDERTVKLNMSDGERQFYDFFEKDSFQKVQAMTSGRSRIAGGTYAHVLRAILRLRLLCAHGADLLSDADYDISKGFSSLNAIDLEDEHDTRPDKTPRQAYEMFRMMRDATVNACSRCNAPVEPAERADYDDDDGGDDEDGGSSSDGGVGDIFGHLTPCNQLICQRCMPAFLAELRTNAGPDGFGFCSVCETYIKVDTSFPLSREDMEQDERALREVRANPRLARHHGRYGGPHTKTKTLIAQLQRDAAASASLPDQRPIKSVVFSSWTTHLDLIQMALTEAKLEFCRLDGTMARPARTAALETFATSRTVCVFLVSIGAGGLGLNLTAASRVYIMEPQFNPAAEAQAIERVHRLGQTRSVTITKFIMSNSFEEKMVELQEKKMALAHMTVSRERIKGSKEEIRSKLDDLKALFK